MSEPAAELTIEADGDLLTRLHAGDTDSLEALYDRYASYVHGLALRILGSREEADEVTQDVFWLLWKRKIQYDPTRGRLSTWLFAVTRNRSIDRLRVERRRPPSTPVNDESHPARLANPEEDAYIAERRRILMKALGELPAEQQKVLELCFYDGMSHREVAAELDAPLGTVKSRIRMGMEKLKQNLFGHGEHLR